jgi:hypothetical protein
MKTLQSTRSELRCIGLLLLSACAGPSSPPPLPSQFAGGPSQRFDDDLIEHLVGDWNLVRKIRGKEERNRVKAEWILHHQFLQVHMQDAADPPQYEALVIIGYSRADDRYLAHWCDTWGSKYSTDGYGQRSADSIEFEFHFPDGPFFNTFTWDPAAKGWTFLMQNQDASGKRTFFAEDTLQRP